MPSLDPHVFSQTIVLCLLDEELDSPQTKLDKGTHTLLNFPIFLVFFSNFSLSLKKLITFCLYVLLLVTRRNHYESYGVLYRVERLHEHSLSDEEWVYPPFARDSHSLSNEEWVPPPN